MKPFIYYLCKEFPEVNQARDFSLKLAKHNAEQHGLEGADIIRHICLAASVLQQSSYGSTFPNIVVTKTNFSALLKEDEKAMEEVLSCNYVGALAGLNRKSALIKAIKAASEIKPEELVWEDPAIVIAESLYKYNIIDEKWLAMYNPSYYTKVPFYPLETAIKVGNLVAVKRIFAHIIKFDLDSASTRYSTHYWNALRESQKMEVEGRPIFWLAAVCNSANVISGRPSDQTYIDIMEFLEEQLKITSKDDPYGVKHDHYGVKKIDYIKQWGADKEKKKTVLERCGAQQTTVVEEKTSGSVAKLGLLATSKPQDSSPEEDNEPVIVPLVVKMKRRQASE